MTDLSIVHIFELPAQRWRRGLAQSASGALLVVTSLYLLAQIGPTPGLATQLAILGSLGSIGGVWLLINAARNLFG